MNIFKRLKTIKRWHLPLLLILGVPLLVKLVPYHLTDQESVLYGYEWYSDMFGLVKARALLGLVVIALIVFVIDRIKTKSRIVFLNSHKYLILLGISITVSTLMSDFGINAVWGIIGRYEGFLVQLSYLIYAFLLIEMLKKEEYNRLMVDLMSVTAIILGVLSLGQYEGFNVLNWYPFRVLLSNQQIASQVQFLVFDSKMAYGTLGNPNYLGAYSALVFPVILYRFVLETKRGTLYFVASCATFSSLIVSQSSAAFLGALFGTSLVYLTNRNQESVGKRKMRLMYFVSLMILIVLHFTGSLDLEITYLTCFALMLLGILSHASHLKTVQFSDQNRMGFIIGLGVVIGFVALMIAPKFKQEEFIKNISINQEGLHFDSTEGNLTFRVESDYFKVYDEHGKEIKYKMDHGIIQSDNRTLKNLEIQLVDKKSYKEILIKRTNMHFVFEPKLISYLNQDNQIVEIDKVTRIGFKELGHLFSCRGYLWSMSLPVFLDHFWIGTGPDTYVFISPQYDIVGKFNMFGTPHMIIDKPHNLYLQVGIQNGVVALLAYIFLLKYIFIKGFKKMKNSHYLIGYLSGIAGYSITAFFYDSSIGVSIMFWTLAAGALSAIESEL